MCDFNCVMFGARVLKHEEIKGKKIIDIGSRNINGNLRPIVEGHNPSIYIGIDVMKGKDVDIICRCEDLLNIFDECSFDVVIATEILEHIYDWRHTISIIKKICKPNGVILLTTRSEGFEYHGYPHDYWRFGKNDMFNIFSDCEILVLESEENSKGIFIKVKKKEFFIENNLNEYPIYNIIKNKKVLNFHKDDKGNFLFQLKVAKIHFKEKIKKKCKKIIDFF